MTDLVADLRKGRKLENAAASIAPDYGFHPSLLVRKFHEAYPDGLPRLAAPKDLARMEDRIIKKHIEENVGMVLTIDELLQNDEDFRKTMRRVCGL